MKGAKLKSDNIKKRIIKPVFKILSYAFSYRGARVCADILNRIYSSSVQRIIKECGKNFKIERPIFIRGENCIVIGENFTALNSLRIEAYEKYEKNAYIPEIIIGNNVGIGENCHIGCINRIEIGNNVLIASRVFITDHFHGEINKENLLNSPAKRKLFSKGAVIIEENVWIGEGVAIMPGVRIGKNSIIGANSVVTKDIPENSVIGGVPGTIIKKII